jgi:hypothetical protein
VIKSLPVRENNLSAEKCNALALEERILSPGVGDFPLLLSEVLNLENYIL